MDIDIIMETHFETLLTSSFDRLTNYLNTWFDKLAPRTDKPELILVKLKNEMACFNQALPKEATEKSHQFIKSFLKHYISKNLKKPTRLKLLEEALNKAELLPKKQQQGIIIVARCRLASLEGANLNLALRRIVAHGRKTSLLSDVQYLLRLKANPRDVSPSGKTAIILLQNRTNLEATLKAQLQECLTANSSASALRSAGLHAVAAAAPAPAPASAPAPKGVM
jgi:hypothetical protein